MSPITLNCTGADGVNRPFVANVSQGLSPDEKASWRFTVRLADSSPLSDFFEPVIDQQPNGTGRITVMANNRDAALQAKGIPDALLPEAAKLTGLPIVSSSNNFAEPGEFRSTDATKVWDRLVSKGMAKYDRERDVYRLC